MIFGRLPGPLRCSFASSSLTYSMEVHMQKNPPVIRPIALAIALVALVLGATVAVADTNPPQGIA